jgi:hypothetical protein
MSPLGRSGRQMLPMSFSGCERRPLSPTLKAAIPIVIGLTDTFNNIGVSHKLTQGGCS